MGTLYCIIPKWPSNGETTWSASMGRTVCFMWFPGPSNLSFCSRISQDCQIQRMVDEDENNHEICWHYFTSMFFSMSFPYHGQLAHRRSAARLADSSVGVFCSPQPSFFYLSFLCLSVTTYFRCSGCVIQWQIWRTMHLIKAIFQPILLNNIMSLLITQLSWIFDSYWSISPSSVLKFYFSPSSMVAL